MYLLGAFEARFQEDSKQTECSEAGLLVRKGIQTLESHLLISLTGMMEDRAHCLFAHLLPLLMQWMWEQRQNREIQQEFSMIALLSSVFPEVCSGSEIGKVVDGGLFFFLWWIFLSFSSWHLKIFSVVPSWITYVLLHYGPSSICFFLISPFTKE